MRQHGLDVLIDEIYPEMNCMFCHFKSIQCAPAILSHNILQLRAEKTEKNKIMSCGKEQDNNALQTYCKVGMGTQYKRLVCDLGQDTVFSSVHSHNMQLVELTCVVFIMNQKIRKKMKFTSNPQTP